MMRKSLRFLLLLFGLMAVSIVLTLAIGPTVDLTSHRDLLSRYTSSLLERPVTLAGQTRLTIGTSATVEISDLRIGNPGWAKQPHFFSATDLVFEIDLPRLASGMIRLKDIRSHRIEIAGERSADGLANWHLEGSEPTAGTQMPWLSRKRMLVEQASIDKLILTYDDSKRDKPWEMQLDQVRQWDDDGIVTLEASGLISNTAFHTAGRFGTLEQLLSGTNIRLDLKSTLGDSQVRIHGSIEDLKGVEEIRLNAELVTQDLRLFAEQLGINLPIDGDAALTLRLQDSSEALELSADGNLGDTTFMFEGATDKDLDFRRFDTRFQIEGRDLSALGEAAGLDSLPPDAFEAQGGISREESSWRFDKVEVKTASSSVYVDGALPRFPTLADARGDIRIALRDTTFIDELVDGAPSLNGPLQFDATLRESADDRTQINADTRWQGTQARVTGTLGQGLNLSGTELRFSMSGQDLAELLAPAGIGSELKEDFQVSGDITIPAGDRLDLKSVAGSVGGIEFEARGSVGLRPQFAESALNLEIRGKSLATALQPFIETELPNREFSVTTQATGSITAPLLQNSVLEVGNARLALPGQVDPIKPYQGTNTGFDLYLPRLSDWISTAGSAEWADREYRATGRLTKPGDRFQFANGLLATHSADWDFDASISEQFTLSSLVGHASTSGDNLSAYIPTIPGFRPSLDSFELDARMTGGHERFTIDELQIRSAGNQLTTRGSVELGTENTLSSLNLDLTVPDLSRIGQVNNLRLPEQAVRLRAQLDTSDSAIRASQFRLEVANGTIDGTMAIRRGSRIYLDLRATAKDIDLAPFFAHSKDSMLDASTSEQSEKRTRWLPSDTLPFLALRDFDAQLELHGVGIRSATPGSSLSTLRHDFDLVARLRDGRMQIAEFHLEGDSGELTGKGSLDVNDDPNVNLAMETRNSRLGWLYRRMDIEQLPMSDINLRLSAQGDSLAALAATLNAELTMSGDSGTTIGGGIDDELGAIGLAVTEALNPFGGSEPLTDVECHALAAYATNGLVSFNPGLALRTKKVDTMVRGTVDLKTESLNLQFDHIKRRGIDLNVKSLVRPHVRMTGSLSEPDLSLAATSALVSGGTAAATGGASVALSRLLDRARAADNPCEKVIESAAIDNAGQDWNPLKPMDGFLELLP